MSFHPRLHLRLLLVMFLMLSAGWFVLWLSISANTTRTAADDIDERLNHAAFSLLLGWNEAERAHGLTPADETIQITHSRPTPWAYPEFEFLTIGGRTLSRSVGYPRGAPENATVKEGFEQFELDGVQWRQLTVFDAELGLFCRVAIQVTQRDLRDAQLASSFADPVLLAFPALGLIVCLGIWQGLRPLRLVTRQLANRDGTDLEPLKLDNSRTPAEVHGLIMSLDALLARLRQTLAAQRAFTSAVGHELRTPLAGFKAQVQVATRAAGLDDKNRSLHKLGPAITRMERLVDQLLMLARLDPAGPRMRKETFDIVALVANAVSSRAIQVNDDATSLKLHAPDAPITFCGDATLIAALIGNLLDNAIRYSPEGGCVQVNLHSIAGGVELTVDDEGPGLPEAERERVFENFYSSDDQRREGSGLGLGLVRAVARAHGGDATIEASETGGARARVRLLTGASLPSLSPSRPH